MTSKKVREKETLYFYRDDANNPILDFACFCPSLAEVTKLAATHISSHAFCSRRNLVYDFNVPHDSSQMRTFTPNAVYQHKQRLWLQDYHTQKAPDERQFFIFKNASTWCDWECCTIRSGLSAVREFLKQQRWQWSHAFCPADTTLLNFSFSNQKLLQKALPFSDAYLARFQYWSEH